MSDERDVMRDRIESLQAERAALVAENEKLREALRAPEPGADVSVLAELESAVSFADWSGHSSATVLVESLRTLLKLVHAVVDEAVENFDSGSQEAQE